MQFRNPLGGRYQITNVAFLRERANRVDDPRCKFYEAILLSASFEEYYLRVGNLVVKPNSTSYEINADMEIKYAVKRGWVIDNQDEVIEDSFDSDLPDVDLDMAVTEGGSRLVLHLQRERKRALIEAKKAAVLNKIGSLKCEACNFDFSLVYGKYGKGFCEVHHTKPLSDSKEAVTTTLNDLAILCSNCHRIIHRSEPMLSIAELSNVIQSCHP